MTRHEFLDNVTTWDDLILFCIDHGLDNCDDIYDEDRMDECLNEEVMNWRGSWWGLRDYLADIHQGSASGYYYRSAPFDWSDADDDDFEEIKSDVLEIMDDADMWDDDAEEDEEDPEIFDDPIPEEPSVDEEDFSVEDLFTICFRQASEKEEKKPEDDFSIIF